MPTQAVKIASAASDRRQQLALFRRGDVYDRSLQADQKRTMTSRGSRSREIFSSQLTSLICPTGNFPNSLSSPFRKNISLRRLVETALLIRYPVPQEGALRGRHGRWVRDAMDVKRRVQSLHGRTACLRTAKSCGPDTPTLVSSWRDSADDGGNKARSPGRARRKPLKPLRREGRVSGEPVVTNARVYYTTRGCGCIGHPAFPAPSVWRDKVRAHNSGASRREMAVACPRSLVLGRLSWARVLGACPGAV
jgi:hypothetical protein